ncbi:uncharacterized protein LOC144178006 isoform X2 [Haemaphysalis longicornis]
MAALSAILLRIGLVIFLRPRKPCHEVPNGWKFLQAGNTIQQLIRNYDISERITPCLSATTIVKNNETHQVTEAMKYFNGTSKTWMSFNWTFQFYEETRRGHSRYNFMNKTAGSGSPKAAYRFLYTDDNCTVLQLVNLVYSKPEPRP